VEEDGVLASKEDRTELASFGGSFDKLFKNLNDELKAKRELKKLAEEDWDKGKDARARRLNVVKGDLLPQANKEYSDAEDKWDEVVLYNETGNQAELLSAAHEYFAEEARKKSEEAARVKTGGATDGQLEAYDHESQALGYKLEDMKYSLQEKYGKGWTRLASPEELRQLSLIDDELEKIALLLKGKKAKDEDKKKNEEHGVAAALIKEASSLARQSTRQYSKAERASLNEQAENEEKKKAELIKERNRMEAFIPQDYYALRDARAKIHEEAGKIDTDNEDELMTLLRNAKANGDKFLAAGIVQHAAQVGHLNEMVNEFGIPGQDQTDQNGFNAFINKNFVGELGMNKQWAYAFQNNLSDIAQGINHWSLAQSVGVAGGKYYQRDLAEQQARVFIESSKKDSEYRLRNANRLGGWFTEHWRDPHDHEQGREAQLNEFGLYEIKNGLKGLVELVGRNRMNPNVMLNLWTNENRRLLRGMRQTLSAPQQKLYDQLEELIRSKIGEPRRRGGIDPNYEFEEMRHVLRSQGARYYAPPLSQTYSRQSLA
jgi:hypothetical protein